MHKTAKCVATLETLQNITEEQDQVSSIILAERIMLP